MISQFLQAIAGTDTAEVNRLWIDHAEIRAFCCGEPLYLNAEQGVESMSPAQYVGVLSSTLRNGHELVANSMWNVLHLRRVFTWGWLNLRINRFNMVLSSQNNPIIEDFWRDDYNLRQWAYGDEVITDPHVKTPIKISAEAALQLYLTVIKSGNSTVLIDILKNTQIFQSDYSFDNPALTDFFAMLLCCDPVLQPTVSAFFEKLPVNSQFVTIIQGLNEQAPLVTFSTSTTVGIGNILQGYLLRAMRTSHVASCSNDQPLDQLVDAMASASVDEVSKPMTKRPRAIYDYSPAFLAPPRNQAQANDVDMENTCQESLGNLNRKRRGGFD